MVSQIFTTLQTAGNGFVSFLSSILDAVMGMFGETVEGAYTLKPLGILTIIGVSVSFVYFAIRWITRLLKLRG